MHEMTEKFLNEAFAGESMAHMKYLIYAEVAEKKGYDNLARMFKAIAYAEFVHAKNHAKNVGLVKEVSDNIDKCIEGENFEVDEMYPVYKATAEIQNEKKAKTGFHYALEAEKIHEKMYERAKEHAEKEEDMDIGEIYICPVCGYTHYKGELPDHCPVCGVKNERFKKF